MGASWDDGDRKLRGPDWGNVALWALLLAGAIIAWKAST